MIASYRVNDLLVFNVYDIAKDYVMVGVNNGDAVKLNLKNDYKGDYFSWGGWDIYLSECSKHLFVRTKMSV